MALALLGILMLMMSSIMSVLSSSTEKADDYVSADMGATYILYTMQEDLVNNSLSRVSVTVDSVIIDSEEDSIVYEIEDSVLRRNSRTITGIISGEFKLEDGFLCVNIVLADRSIMNVRFSLTGRSLGDSLRNC